MPRYDVSGKQIEEFGRKLDQFGNELSQEERALLLGVFGLASTALDEGAVKAIRAGAALPVTRTHLTRTKVDTGKELPRLSDGFMRAFLAGQAGNFSIVGPGPVEDSIGVSVTCVSWSKDYNQEPLQPEETGQRLG